MLFTYGRYGFHRDSYAFYQSLAGGKHWQKKRFKTEVKPGQSLSFVFNPALAQSQQDQDYSYRYYKNSNIYLGIFQDTKVHLLQANESNDIKDVGYLEYYLNLSGCKN
jgi:hypothetical protein